MDRGQQTRKGREPRSALPLRSRSEENRFRLTNSFRKGPTHRRKSVSRGSARRSRRSRTISQCELQIRYSRLGENIGPYAPNATPLSPNTDTSQLGARLSACNVNAVPLKCGESAT